MANLFTSHKVFYATLLPIAEQRIAEREQAMLGHKVPEHVRFSPHPSFHADGILERLHSMGHGAIVQADAVDRGENRPRADGSMVRSRSRNGHGRFAFAVVAGRADSWP